MSNYSSMNLSQLYNVAKSSTQRPYYILNKDKYIAFNEKANQAYDVEVSVKNKLYDTLELLNDAINLSNSALIINNENPFLNQLTILRGDVQHTAIEVEKILMYHQNDETRLDSFDKEVFTDNSNWYNAYFNRFAIELENNLKEAGWTEFEKTSDGIIRIAKRSNENDVGMMAFSDYKQYEKYTNGCPYPTEKIPYGYQNGIYGIDYCVCTLNSNNTYLSNYSENPSQANENPTVDKTDSSVYVSNAHTAFPNLLTSQEFMKRKNAGSYPEDMTYEEYVKQSPKTIKSGQVVIINGHEYRFLARNMHGQMLFSRDSSDLVYSLGDDGYFTPYQIDKGFGQMKHATASEVVEKYKNHDGFQWQVTYNEELPFDDVLPYDASNEAHIFTDAVKKENLNNNYVFYDKDLLAKNSVSIYDVATTDLSDKVHLDISGVPPKSIYLPAGKNLTLDRKVLKDNVIYGDSYLVYDSSVDGYFVVFEHNNYSYYNTHLDDGYFIKREDLINGNLKITN